MQSSTGMVSANSSNINMTLLCCRNYQWNSVQHQRAKNWFNRSGHCKIRIKSKIKQIEISVTSFYTTYIGSYKSCGLIPGNDNKVTAENEVDILWYTDISIDLCYREQFNRRIITERWIIELTGSLNKYI